MLGFIIAIRGAVQNYAQIRYVRVDFRVVVLLFWGSLELFIIVEKINRPRLSIIFNVPTND